MKSSRGSRSFKLLSLAAKVGKSELAQTLKNKFIKQDETSIAAQAAVRVQQAQWIAENLSQMKGAAMKAGQLLSIDAGEYFPPEAMAVLRTLQASAEPMDFDRLRPVLVEDIGEKKIGDFEQLSGVPEAAASIGQVHRARLFEREVAIKIQYPGVAEAVDSDIAILRRLISTFIDFSGRDMDLNPLFDELKRVLTQEADYQSELQLMKAIRQHLQGDSRYRVPEAIESHSGRRVLTMSWEQGSSVESWLKSRPSKESRERIGHAILDLFCREFFDWGLVQTDPNFANFLIAPDEALVLLDFGATLKYDEEFRKRYREFLIEMGTLDEARIIKAGQAFGILDERESDEAKRSFADLLIHSIEPFFATRQPFQFEDADYARRTRDAGFRLVKMLRYSPPPHQILFLHRKLGGIFNFVKLLDVRLDLTPYWQKMVGVPQPTGRP